MELTALRAIDRVLLCLPPLTPPVTRVLGNWGLLEMDRAFPTSFTGQKSIPGCIVFAGKQTPKGSTELHMPQCLIPSAPPDITYLSLGEIEEGEEPGILPVFEMSATVRRNIRVGE